MCSRIVRAKKYNDQKLRLYSSYLSIIAYATLFPVEQKEYKLTAKHILAKQELVLFAPAAIVDFARELELMDMRSKENTKNICCYLIICEMI
ncbi:MAG: hypothetical protein Q4B80_05700 [Aerococcaceae bacterium]|nr:hypothetical protein [Aerococcaceae bacterium]